MCTYLWCECDLNEQLKHFSLLPLMTNVEEEVTGISTYNVG